MRKFIDNRCQKLCVTGTIGNQNNILGRVHTSLSDIIIPSKMSNKPQTDMLL